jgi:hypothetical protein
MIGRRRNEGLAVVAPSSNVAPPGRLCTLSGVSQLLIE